MKGISFADVEQSIINAQFSNNQNKYFAYFASKTYKNLNLDEIKNLNQFIVEKIENDGFKPIFLELEKYLNESIT